MITNVRSDRVKQVKALGRRSARDKAGLFLVEGRQAVRELIRFAPTSIRDVYLDADAAERHPDLRELAGEWADGTPAGERRFVHDCSPQVLAAMCDTEQPQGIIAVARPIDRPLADVLAGSLLGLVAAYFSYRQYYPSLAAPYAERPYSPRIPREERLPVHAREGPRGVAVDAETERELEAQTVRRDEEGRMVWKDDDDAETMSLRGNMS